MIELKVGKIYKDRDGNTIGPMFHDNEYEEYPFTDGCYTFTRFGAYYDNGTKSFRDLVEEFKTDIDTTQKPPIGLTPQNIFLELQNKQRVQDILDACSRYNEDNMNILQDWLDELSYRLGVKKD